MIVNNIRPFLNDKQVDFLYKSLEKKPMMKAIIGLMLDAGLRISETLELRNSHLDFKNNYVRVRTLKQKSERFRDVPMPNNLLFILSDYFNSKAYLGTISDPNFLIFTKQHNGKLKPITRQAVWHCLKTLSRKHHILQGLKPHMLRHTYATRLVHSEGVNLVTVKELLGHTSINSTEIYSHVPKKLMEDAVSKLDKKNSWIARLRQRLFPKKFNKPVPIFTSKNSFIVGRNKVIEQIEDLTHRNINILLIGKQGTGKSLILNNFSSSKRILKIDDLNSPKQTLKEILIYLLKGDKSEIATLLYSDINEGMRKQVSRMTIKNLCESIKKITQKNEYIITIDDITRIGANGIDLIEFFKSHFIIVTACRQLAINKSSFTSNFEVIELNNLDRKDSLNLIDRLSSDILTDIEDYYLYQNHIFEQTNGNPQFMFEIINRYRAEKFISTEVVREIRHTAGRQQIDVTIFFIAGLSCLMILRYLGKASGDMNFQLIGGIFLVIALLSRQIYMLTRRKFL